MLIITATTISLGVTLLLFGILLLGYLTGVIAPTIIPTRDLHIALNLAKAATIGGIALLSTALVIAIIH